MQKLKYRDGMIVHGCVHIRIELILPKSMPQSLYFWLVCLTHHVEYHNNNKQLCHRLKEYQHTTDVNINHVLYPILCLYLFLNIYVVF